MPARMPSFNRPMATQHHMATQPSMAARPPMSFSPQWNADNQMAFYLGLGLGQGLGQAHRAQQYSQQQYSQQQSYQQQYPQQRYSQQWAAGQPQTTSYGQSQDRYSAAPQIQQRSVSYTLYSVGEFSLTSENTATNRFRSRRGQIKTRHHSHEPACQRFCSPRLPTRSDSCRDRSSCLG